MMSDMLYYETPQGTVVEDRRLPATFKTLIRQLSSLREEQGHNSTQVKQGLGNFERRFAFQAGFA